MRALRKTTNMFKFSLLLAKNPSCPALTQGGLRPSLSLSLSLSSGLRPSPRWAPYWGGVGCSRICLVVLGVGSLQEILGNIRGLGSFLGDKKGLAKSHQPIVYLEPKLLRCLNFEWRNQWESQTTECGVRLFIVFSLAAIPCRMHRISFDLRS